MFYTQLLRLKQTSLQRQTHCGIEAKVTDVTGDDGLLPGRSHAKGVVYYRLLNRVHLLGQHRDAGVRSPLVGGGVKNTSAVFEYDINNLEVKK